MKTFCLGLMVVATVADDTTNVYDNFGRVEGAVGTTYDPTATKSCCEQACAPGDCSMGCDTWLGKSSLNWEAEVSTARPSAPTVAHLVPHPPPSARRRTACLAAARFQRRAYSARASMPPRVRATDPPPLFRLPC
jgi:hypothetical protein